jgi:hypothetical protein
MPAPPHNEDDDDFELELEPIDPEIVAAQQQHAHRKTEEAVAKIDIDEILREKDDQGDYYVDWSWLKSFRFTTRHALMLTAVLAMGLTLFKVLGGCSGLFVIGMIALGVAWFFVMRAEQRRAAERERIRKEFFATRGASIKAAMASGDAATASAPGPPQPRFDVRFSFSLKETLIAMTGAAVFMGLVSLVGMEGMAMTLGIVALVGLAVNAMGFDPPRMVVLGWWVLLVFYLVFGFITAVRSVS